MKKHLILFTLSLLVLTAFVIGSREKTDTSVDSQSAQDEAKAQSAVSDAFAIASNADTDGGGGKALGDCPTITRLTAAGVFPKKYKLQFPEAGCDALGNGVIHKGTIYVTFDRTWGEGASLTTEFEAYSRDGNTFTGTVSAVYTKTLPIPEHTITSTNCVLKTTDGKEVSYNSVQTFKMIEGASTPLIPEDNKIEMNGTSNGTNTNGEAFTTTSLGVTKIYGCRFPVAGTVTFTDGAVLNFDEDQDATNTPECNTLVRVTKLGLSAVVDLKK